MFKRLGILVVSGICTGILYFLIELSKVASFWFGSPLDLLIAAAKYYAYPFLILLSFYLIINFIVKSVEKSKGA